MKSQTHRVLFGMRAAAISLVSILLLNSQIVTAFAKGGTPPAQVSSITGLELQVMSGYTSISSHGYFGPYGLNGFSTGVNIGYAWTESFRTELTASRMFESAAAYSYLFGVLPKWTFYRRGALSFNGGVLAGLRVLHEEYFPNNPMNLGGAELYDYPRKEVISADRFVAGPTLSMETRIWGGWSGLASVQYEKVFGPEKNVGSLGLMGGVGFRF